MADVDAVITQFSPLKAEVIAAMHKVRVIVRFGDLLEQINRRAVVAYVKIKQRQLCVGLRRIGVQLEDGFQRLFRFGGIIGGSV